MNQTLKIVLALLIAIITANAQAQVAKKETTEEYITRLKSMADSIKNAKKNNANTSKNSSSNAVVNVSTKYSTKKSTIDNAYNFLTASEKEIVKNYPPVPVAFRTSVDAQNFLSKLNGIDINATIKIAGKSKSMALTGYCISYQSLKNKATEIVQEAAKLKAEFDKKNPSINFGTNIGKTYVGENSLVYLPLGDASFADVVVGAKFIKGNIQFPTDNCLGTPNYVLMKKLENNIGIYSLGLNGSLTIQFLNNALVDVVGPDLFVFEAGEIEPTTLEISKDGTTWINVGKISGGTASVDISKYVKPNEYYYYIRLTDLNTQSTVAGADIDAIATIGAAIRLSLNAEVLFDVGKAELKKEGIDAIKKLALSLQNIQAASCNIEGHTDDVGSDEANKNLSLQRANAVAMVLKEALKNKTAFSFSQVGKGKMEPTVPNTTTENRKLNRRVEILVSPK